MKKHLAAFGILILGALFYLSLGTTFVGIGLLILEPSIIAALLLLIPIVILAAYLLAFKVYPRFKESILFFLETTGSLS